MAHARARQAWPSARASGDVIHWLAPLGSAVFPSRDAAIFMRTHGVFRTMRLKKPMLSSRDAIAMGSSGGKTTTSTPAARRRSKPCPATSGLGSVLVATTRLIPAAINASQHGPVRPWWEQGSSVTYAVAPTTEFPLAVASRNAMISAWKLPTRWVWPLPKALPLGATITQPTRGLGEVMCNADLASPTALSSEAHSSLLVTSSNWLLFP